MFRPYSGNKFFNGNELMTHNAKYNIILSERNNGKSFWFLQYCVCDYFNYAHQFGYVRRYGDEIRNMKVDEYFEDKNFIAWLQKTFDYDGIICDRGKLYFFKWDGGKKKKFEVFGNVFAVQKGEEYKSRHFDEVVNICYEEFITAEKPYLRDEYKTFSNLVSTIARGREVKVFLLGNTIARDCPHLLEYGIDIFKVKQNEIVIINHNSENGKVKVAFYYAPQKSTSNMFFGKAEKTIVGGQWEIDEMPHLFCDLKDVEKLYTCYMITSLRQAFKLVLFLHDTGRYVYVYPYDYDEIPYTLGADIFTDTFTTKENYYMHPTKKRHKLLYELYVQDKFVYSHNLCGTEFKKALRNYNPFR